METAEILAETDRQTLTDLVRRAQGSDSFVISDWSQRAVYGGISRTGGGIYRFAGTGFDRGERRPWSLILKILRATPGADDPTHFDYWKRELRVYESGLLDDLPPDLRAPRCYGWVEQPNVAWLWLEEIVELIAKPWPLERCGLVARHLATLSGRYLVDRPVPSFPWLTRDLTRALLDLYGSYLPTLRELRDHPLVKRGWPDDQLARTERLLDERAEYLAILDGLPRTLGHGDATPLNLFAGQSPEGRDQTIAIDWAFTGIGAIGEDLATLIRCQTRPATTFEDLDRVIFDGYVTGLRAAGWQGDARLVRIGYAIAAAFRYGVNLRFVPPIVDVQTRAQWEQAFGTKLENMLDRGAQVRGRILALADEARELHAVV